jgi:putative thioredoxin
MVMIPEPFKDVTTATFLAEVCDASFQTPVIAYFWAPWASSCQKLGPILERAVHEAGGVARITRVNVDENPELAQQLRISSVPSVYAFIEGRPIDGFVGPLPERYFQQFLRRLWLLWRLANEPGVASTIELAMGMANRELQAGNPAGAKVLYSQILRYQPGNADAIGGLGRVTSAITAILRAAELRDAGRGDATTAASATQLAAISVESQDRPEGE